MTTQPIIPCEQNRDNLQYLAHPHVMIRIGETENMLEPADFLDLAARHEDEELLQATEETVRLSIVRLLEWPDNARFQLFSLILSASAYEVNFPPRSQTYTDLYEAVLGQLQQCTDIRRMTRGKQAALEAATLVHPHGVEFACRQIHRRLTDLGLGISYSKLVKEARNLLGESSPEAVTSLQAAKQFLLSLHAAESSVLSEAMPHLIYYRESFWEFRGLCWQPLEDRNFRARLTRFIQQEPLYAKVGKRFLGDVEEHLKGLVHLACWEQAMPFEVESWEPLRVIPSRHRNFQNGMLDLQDLVAGEPDYPPDLERSSPCHVTPVVLPYPYQPDAACPLWLDTLADIFPREHESDRRIEILQEFFGDTLLGNQPIYQRFLAMVGDGANGKSTILHVWKSLLGSQNVSHVSMEDLNDKFRLAEMDGKLANLAADMNYMTRVAEGRLKQLTSGDPLQVERKYKSPTTMLPTARLVFATNALPQFNDRSDGVWRRLLAMPFLASFRGNRDDIHRSQRLRAELPGIFNWAIRGARRLVAQRQFSTCSVCGQCADEHRTQSDAFRQFVEERVQFGPYQHGCQDLYRDYVDFCERNGRKPTHSGEFKKRVQLLDGVRQIRPGSGTSRPRIFEGLRLIPSYDRFSG